MRIESPAGVTKKGMNNSPSFAINYFAIGIIFEQKNEESN
jgi:hypothetical protein